MPTLKKIPPGTGFEHLTEAVTSEFGQLVELVRQALREKLKGTPGYSEYYVDVCGIFADRVVAKLAGRMYSYPYALSAENAVSVGDGTEVVMAFTAVRESAPVGQFREAADGSIEVTVIRSGLSINNAYYSDALLRESAPAFEGVRVFVKADAEHTAGGGKDVRNLLGGIYATRFVEGATPDTGCIVGTFRPIDPADAVVTKMTEAVKRGLQGLMGLSIDADARTKQEQRGGRKVRVARQFVRVRSVDLIVSPGAGGGLDRLTEAAATDPESQDGETMLKKRLYEALTAINAAHAAKITLDTATDDQVITALTEACTAASLNFGAVMAASSEADPKASIARLMEAARTAASTQRLTEAEGDAPVTRAELALFQARGYATTRIAASTLPAAAKEKLGAELQARERLTEAEVDQAITKERDYLAKFTESGRPTGGFPRIEVGDRRVVITDMLDAFFDPTHKEHRNVRSFREAYIEITGDKLISGRPDQVRLTESIGTDTFADALGSSITRRMQAVYRDAVQYDAWRQVVTTAPVNDFRVQERTQIGGFGDLPTVAERGPYTSLADPTDDKATYSVTKKGGLAQITMEAIKNDDVGAIRRVPVELGRSSKRTLFKFVFNFFAANGVTWDGLALYHATHANLFTAALDATSLAAHRLAMKKQTGRDTATRMEIGPKFLLVPDDLEEGAVNLFNRNTNNDATFVQKLSLTIIPVPTWTDVNDWVTLADPMDMPVLEIGFLDGQEEPVLLVQENATEGSVFTNDTISYKVRHIYGGNVLVDGHKGTTKAVVP